MTRSVSVCGNKGGPSLHRGPREEARRRSVLPLSPLDPRDLYKPVVIPHVAEEGSYVAGGRDRLMWGVAPPAFRVYCFLIEALIVNA